MRIKIDNMVDVLYEKLQHTNYLEFRVGKQPYILQLQTKSWYSPKVDCMTFSTMEKNGDWIKNSHKYVIDRKPTKAKLRYIYYWIKKSGAVYMDLND